MRKASLFFLIALAAVGAEARSRHQSYFTFEDGGTVVRQGEDTVDARVNLPIFPGDEVQTSRRGRAEIRLADGNVIAMDRGTTIQFRSILDSYDGDATQTVAQLDFGLAIVHRFAEDSTAIRLDTTNASYVSSRDAIYSVETDGRGSDMVSVYEGGMEVRTAAKTSRLRAGEQARVDNQGVYGTNNLVRDGETDFERWFLRRADRYDDSSSRYLDRRLAYANPELDDHGSWVYANDYSSYVWRPRVASGWRPYRDGSWVHSPYGGLVWASYEPWGWVPYHYGRWAWSGPYGWVWLPGSGYSPAWVYWAFGPSYVGWAPAGWYDCSSSYYDWAYRPYRRVGFDVGFGFHGRIRLTGADLTPWTFVSSNQLMSNRVDRAALTTDAIRGRLSRDGDQATLTNNVRFTRSELRDPASAASIISRNGIGGGTGREGSGPTADLTPFFRRDPELSSSIRQRVTRMDVPRSGLAPATGGTEPSGRISRGDTTTPGAPSRPRSVAIGRGDSAPSSPASPAGGSVRRERPAVRELVEPDREDGRATIRRDRTPAPRAEGNSQSGEEASRQSNERSRVRREPAENAERTPRDQSWRGSTPGVNPSGTGDSRRSRDGARSREAGTPERSRDVPRRVIEGIGGVRVTPRREADSPRPEKKEAPREVERRNPERQQAPREAAPAPRNQGDAQEGRIKRDNQE